jgi:hypothetical protein
MAGYEETNEAQNVVAPKPSVKNASHFLGPSLRQAMLAGLEQKVSKY